MDHISERESKRRRRFSSRLGDPATRPVIEARLTWLQRQGFHTPMALAAEWGLYHGDEGQPLPGEPPIPDGYTPPRGTLRHRTRRFKYLMGLPWNISEASPEDVAAAGPVLAAMLEDTAGRVTVPTVREVALIRQFRTLAPDAPLWLVWRAASGYDVGDKRDQASIDAVFAAGVWRSAEHRRRFLQWVYEYRAPWHRRLVSTGEITAPWGPRRGEKGLGPLLETGSATIIRRRHRKASLAGFVNAPALGLVLFDDVIAREPAP